MKTFNLLDVVYSKELQPSTKVAILNLKDFINQLYENPYKYLKSNSKWINYDYVLESILIATVANSIVKEPTEVYLFLNIWTTSNITKSKRFFKISKDYIRTSKIPFNPVE